MPSASVPPPAAQVLPRLGVRDPDYWLAWLAYATVAFSCLQVLLFSFGRDQGIYAVVADKILDGGLPYRDVWDFKPPGIFLVYALAQALFGKSMLAPRLLEVVGMLGMVAGIVFLGKQLFGSRHAGLLGGALAALVHAELEFWHTGQPESFGGFLTVLGLVLTIAEVPRSRRFLRWGALGVVWGAAFLFKPPLGGGLVVSAAYLARRHGARGGPRAVLEPALCLAMGAAVPVLACAAWFWLAGGWSELTWTLGEFVPGYTALSWQGRSAPTMFYYALEEAFFRLSALLAFGFIAAIVIRPLFGREREGVFLVLGFVSLHLAGIAMQGKFFAYHYGATIPLLAFVAGLGLYKLWRRCLSAGAGGTAAFALFLIVAASMRDPVRDLPQTFWQRSLARTGHVLGLGPYRSTELLEQELYYVSDYSLNADRRVARELDERLAPDDFLYVWGFEPTIYWLTELRSASRFIYNVPQRALWGRDAARALLERDLEARPPGAIVVQRTDVFPAVTGSYDDSRTALDDYPKMARLLERDYELVRIIDDFALYTRRDEPRAARAPRHTPARKRPRRALDEARARAEGTR